ncbi:MAG: short-chain dehydrogenase/reductase [Bryobacterales bacterium]|nr:short-chain dehydrogenase/reductase [Bryobacterales bacterium]
MSRYLDGKTAVVTGGARGIGKAIARRLLEAGASVAICSKSGESIERALSELGRPRNLVGRRADVGNPDDVAALFDFVDAQFGALDILVNNAGIGIFGAVADLSIEEWRATLDTNLSGAFYCSRAAIPRLKARGGGYIINIGSLAGKNAFAGGAAYNASKFGLDGFTEAMMLDYRKDKIRVSEIMPGSVATGFGSGGGEDWKISPEDIAELVITLLAMPERTLVSRLEVRPSRPGK